MVKIFYEDNLYSKKRLKLKTTDIARIARGLSTDDIQAVWGLKRNFEEKTTKDENMVIHVLLGIVRFPNPLAPERHLTSRYMSVGEPD